MSTLFCNTILQYSKTSLFFEKDKLLKTCIKETFIISIPLVFM